MCNLTPESVGMIANAVVKSKTIGGISCVQNPFNFPNGEFDPRSDEIINQAVISSIAPIEIVNNEPISKDIQVLRENRRRGVSATVNLPLSTPKTPEQVIALGFQNVKDFLHEQKILKNKEEENAKQVEQANLRKVQEINHNVKSKIRKVKDRAQKEIQRLEEEANKKVQQLQYEGNKKVQDLEEQTRQAKARVAVVDKEVKKAKLALEEWEKQAKAKHHDLCCVCEENPKEYVFIPCGHRFCEKDAKKIFNSTRICPLDRKHIQDIMKTF